MRYITATILFCFPDINAVELSNISESSQEFSAVTYKSATYHKSLESAINRSITSLDDFKQTYHQFDYGVRSIEGLYDAMPEPEKMFAEMAGHNCLRSAMFAGEILLGTSCEVVKNLSIFYPNTYMYGNILIGLYIAKSVLWGVDSWVHNSDKQASIVILNALQTDPLLIQHISTISSQINEIDFSPVMRIAKFVLDIESEYNLTPDDQIKFNRLSELYAKLEKTHSTRGFFLVGGKIISFLTGIAAGISVSISGQKSPPSFWLTLFAGGLDSIVATAHTTITKKPIVQRYITISEILYLSDYFLSHFREP